MKAVEADRLSVEPLDLRATEPLLVTQGGAPVGIFYPIKAWRSLPEPIRRELWETTFGRGCGAEGPGNEEIDRHLDFL